MSTPAPGARFLTTRWSQVLAAGAADGPARAALAWLCERYWDALRAHVRRRGFDATAAEDLTQDFLVAVIGGGVVERADRARGRFRTFLLACLDHHLGHARARATALKRGGGIAAETLPAAGPAVEHDPGRAFDRDWAGAVLARARDRLRAEQVVAGQGERHDRLACFLAANGDAAAYVAAGAALGLGEGAVKVAVHRLRSRLRELLREEVAQTLGETDEGAIDGELRDLLAALAEGR